MERKHVSSSQFSAIRSIKIVAPVPQFIETESIKILQLYKKRRDSTLKSPEYIKQTFY